MLANRLITQGFHSDDGKLTGFAVANAVIPFDAAAFERELAILYRSICKKVGERDETTTNEPITVPSFAANGVSAGSFLRYESATVNEEAKGQSRRGWVVETFDSTRTRRTSLFGIAQETLGLISTRADEPQLNYITGSTGSGSGDASGFLRRGLVRRARTIV